MQYLILNQSHPWHNNTAQDALDLTIALSTFEQLVQLIFTGDGVLQLLNNQQANLLYRKNFTQTFKALAIYDVHDIYVDETSMLDRMLTVNDFIIPVTLTTTAQIAKFITTADIVLNF